MIRCYAKALNGAVMVLALVLAAMPLHLAHAQEPEALKIRVETTDSGFRCVSQGSNCIGEQNGDFIIEVGQGSLVELTFAWAHQGYSQEEHIIVLEKYNLETDEINTEHREATLKFIADKPGAFNFKCDLECEIHDYMQRGYLKVKRGGTSAATYTPTKVSLIPSSWVTAGDPVNLMAILRDNNGNPVPKAEVTFFVDAEFGGAKGKMLLGKIKTDANGVAFLDYQPYLAHEHHVITARFEGMGIYSESEEAIEVQELGMPPPAYRMEAIGLEGIRRAAPLALAFTVALVWMILGFILFQALGVAWTRGRREKAK